MEALVRLCLYRFFGEDIKSNFNQMLGGSSCKNAIDGQGKCEDNTKGAYNDYPLFLKDRIVYPELDENKVNFLLIFLLILFLASVL